MKPIVVLVGRPNVGKSTLFNRLTKTRDALVADIPGLTRDRHYGHGKLGDKPFLVVDTGGFEPLAKDGILHEMARQTEQAIAEADAVIFVVDGRTGITALDKEIANKLRKAVRPVFVAVNKAEGMNQGIVSADFHELGLGEPRAISATHGEGVRDLIELALEPYAGPDENEGTSAGLKVAIAGRPNVGKSTMINALLGEERVIAFDQPGTTRDAIYIDFERSGKHYTLIDTAGLRRKGKVFETLEKFSVIKTLQSIEDAQVVVLVLDARQDISDQDAHIAGFVVESGRALVVAVNKWDGLDSYVREQIKADLETKLKFLDFADFHYVSALKGQGLERVFRSVDAAYKAATTDLSTPQLTRALIDAVARQSPPRNGIFRPKLRYAHQGGRNPPVIVIHGNALDKVPESYRRYLEHVFREVFKLQGTPLRIQFNVSKNPFADRKPPEQNRRKPKAEGQGRPKVRDPGKSKPRAALGAQRKTPVKIRSTLA
ncbi:ribosome biogenesis GTPase Der [Propionivibrio sp.]|uniref:ribosome biogenesis GTPase Der n=1 Tax=Propionivibrio sp. TaxID=2212460 RepID=UPI0025FFC812|nr:ribosome biogenesis GTPase Der [Propionivibrio sp.]MBK7355999.1 ribosome biogenesis GTPase Der [Propionivibrio sp.]MBK8400337.1 ribosome biogenesis GTPase Der [Propionivibrio sp.]MBK8743958.1 ribosome biogenesis GTPase Der [Propionivibrio sp.]MBK8892960.1 ribosome biogenesis GTPase Der [Propionivibrio sp.]MBL0207353.1 ribosome biogenesis GTPase Der [Propionivibrio sp.]